MQVNKYYKHRNMIDVFIQIVAINGDKMEIVWWHERYKTIICDDEVPYPSNIEHWYEVRFS